MFWEQEWPLMHYIRRLRKYRYRNILSNHLAPLNTFDTVPRLEGNV